MLRLFCACTGLRCECVRCLLGQVRLADYLKILLDTWLSLDKRWVHRLRHVYNDHARFYYDVNGFMIETTDHVGMREDAKFYALCAFPKLAQILEETDPSIPDSRARMIFDQALAHLHKVS